MHKTLHRNFRGSYFHNSRSIHERRKILHHVKISRYTVLMVILALFKPSRNILIKVITVRRFLIASIYKLRIESISCIRS